MPADTCPACARRRRLVHSVGRKRRPSIGAPARESPRPGRRRRPVPQRAADRSSASRVAQSGASPPARPFGALAAAAPWTGGAAAAGTGRILGGRRLDGRERRVVARPEPFRAVPHAVDAGTTTESRSASPPVQTRSMRFADGAGTTTESRSASSSPRPLAFNLREGHRCGRGPPLNLLGLVGRRRCSRRRKPRDRRSRSSQAMRLVWRFLLSAFSGPSRYQ